MNVMPLTCAHHCLAPYTFMYDAKVSQESPLRIVDGWNTSGESVERVVLKHPSHQRDHHWPLLTRSPVEEDHVNLAIYHILNTQDPDQPCQFLFGPNLEKQRVRLSYDVDKVA